MSLDGFAIHALADELHAALAGGRIDKIQQPDATTIILVIRQERTNYRLLLSANPQTARIGLTEINRTNPLQPPLFCMVLRKHLEGAKILSITQPEWERVIHITCEGYDELGEKATRILIGEFMGKHSNLILLNPETNIVLDSCRHLNLDMSQYRQILPGLHYIAPPPQDKVSLFDLNEENFIAYAAEASPNLSIKKMLLNLISGFGPQTAAEIAYRSGLDPDSRLEFLGEYEYLQLYRQLDWLRQTVNSKTYQPSMIEDGGKPIAFAPFSLQQFEHLTQYKLPTMSKLVEDFIGKKEQSNNLTQYSSDLNRIIQRELERCHKKLALQLEKVQEGEEAEYLKIWGELLTANLYQLKQGNSATVINYYDPEQSEITIPLQANLTPNENAQKYFKRYTKAKNGAEQSLVHIDSTKDEINYLESIQESLANAQTMQDLQDVRLELEKADYVKAKISKQNKKNKKEPTFSPLVIQYGEWQFMIGKNNIQNDYLTTKLARNLDVWFHVKDIHGSHVILKNHQEQREIPTEILDMAAHFAAYFSKGRHSALVPVDYTLKKYVHKPNGSKPGRVIYENQKTIYITPDEPAILDLIAKYGKQ